MRPQGVVAFRFGQYYKWCMARDDLRHFLNQVPIFSDLTGEESDDLIEYLMEVSLPEGRTIFHEGEEGKSLYVIRIGRVGISKTVLKKEEKPLALLGPKSIFGEMALLEGGKRSATATVVEDASLLELSRSDLEALAEENPYAGYKIMYGISMVLSSRLRRMDEEFVGIFSHPFRSIKELERVLKKLQDNFISIGWGKIFTR